MAPPPDTRDAVLYDADCGFCRWALAVLLRWDRRGRLRPVALQDAEAPLLLPGVPGDRRMDSMHVVLADGRVASGGAALVELGRRLPGGGPLAAVGSAWPGVAERWYRTFAGRRATLGRFVGARARRRADELIRERS